MLLIPSLEQVGVMEVTEGVIGGGVVFALLKDELAKEEHPDKLATTV
jgi:hypothetical protein